MQVILFAGYKDWKPDGFDQPMHCLTGALAHAGSALRENRITGRVQIQLPPRWYRQSVPADL